MLCTLTYAVPSMPRPAIRQPNLGQTRIRKRVLHSHVPSAFALVNCKYAYLAGVLLLRRKLRTYPQKSKPYKYDFERQLYLTLSPTVIFCFAGRAAETFPINSAEAPATARARRTRERHGSARLASHHQLSRVELSCSHNAPGRSNGTSVLSVERALSAAGRTLVVW